MGAVTPRNIVLAIIALSILGIGIQISQTGFINARALTNASANFTSGLDITDLLMGLVGALVVIALFLGGAQAVRRGRRR